MVLTALVAATLVACDSADNQLEKQSESTVADTATPGEQVPATKVVSAPAKLADYTMAAEKVADGVYAIITPARDFPNPQNKGWNSNSTFVVTGDGVLVVDTGSSATIGTALLNTIRTVTDKPIRWIVNTHGHGDHWLGGTSIASAQTEVITSTKVKERIKNELGYWVDLFNQMSEGAIGNDSKALIPTTTVDERTTRKMGGVEVTLIPSGDSHSPGDLLVWLPKLKVLIGGDVLYTDRAPGTFEGKIGQWIKLLKELETLDVVKMIPGHGAVGDGQDIINERKYFEIIWNAVAKAVEAGQSDFEVLPVIKEQLIAYEKIYPGLEKQIGRTVSHAYAQAEAAAF
ncbi:MAG TPA: MBL fold metallo-hydrolase [Acidiferrobacteraceae bacterium]|nr:MBL fold metallo-hydrolase [Acidiferrobacteraceae bacterium]